MLRSLAFWCCLLLAAGAYAAATLAPSYVRNQQLRAEYADADARLKQLMTQIDRYEQYCRRLTADGGPDTGPRGVSGVENPVRGLLLQQMVLEESLQFRLDEVRPSAAAAASSPALSPVLGLLSGSALARGVIQAASAVLLLLAFTFFVDLPARPESGVKPRPARRRIRPPLEWLNLRYRSDNGEPAG